ncbi:MAG TPA: BON domain-containing protein [Thermoanaerobaculia bacterium]|nr:BON domain-containing protein [Thermoanaerobaculia bacterium]
MKRQTTQAVLIAMVLTLAPAAFAATPDTTDLTNQFRGANAVVNGLQVYELAGIVIIRGRTADKAQAEVLSNYARSLGYQRIANLVQTVQHDDANIARRAEVELSVHRSLDGCRFNVRSEQGVVHIGGQVTHELQKDVAMQVVRNIDGVRRVEMDLQKF